MEDVEKNKQNLVSPTRSETDSKPLPAISIEILRFGDWKCCKSFFFFLKQWFSFAALLSRSFPLHGSSTAQGQRSSCSAAFPTTPGGSHCPGNAGTGVKLPGIDIPGDGLILLSWKWFERAAKYLLLLPTLSPTPSICSSHFIFHLPQTFRCHWPSYTWMKPQQQRSLGSNGGKGSSKQSWVSLHRAGGCSKVWRAFQSTPALIELILPASRRWHNHRRQLACHPVTAVCSWPKPWCHKPNTHWRCSLCCRQPSHHRHPRQTGDIPSYKPIGEPRQTMR